MKPASPQGGGGGRGAGGALRRLAGIIGAWLGPNGSERRIFWAGCLTIAGIVGGFNAISVITDLHDRPDIGYLAPIVWEGSSWLTFTGFCWIMWFALKLAPLESRPRWRVPLVHVPAFALFAFFHIGGFVAIRKLLYAAYGATYDFSPFVSEFLYEARKDVFGYVLTIGVFWIVRRIVEAPQASIDTGTYDIRDGARLIRVYLADIIAVTAAANYVEFVLRDGRRPLMRTTLTAVEGEMAARGFVRTHRSWLVNEAAVTGLRPEGSGDYTVELGPIAVPLSRRFPEALARLRRS